ncbi:MAG: hypothetical protein JWO25_3199 [Alphaproteobacteria bacterium]|nr:hypothetical protein [Alphaproteobacteria bacterium]
MRIMLMLAAGMLAATAQACIPSRGGSAGMIGYPQQGPSQSLKCRRADSTNPRQSKRVCRTYAEWAEIDRQSQTQPGADYGKPSQN